MAVAAAYATGWIGPELIQRGQARTLQCPIYLAGALVQPVSGAFTLTDNMGVVRASGVTAQAGSMATFALVAGDTSALNVSERWRCEWVLVMPDGVTHTFDREALLVFRRLICPVSQADLTRTHPELLRRKDTSVASLDGWILEAWAATIASLQASQKLLWLNLDNSALREPVRASALGLVFRSLSEGATDSRDLTQAEHYERKADLLWSTVTLPQADPETGLPTGRRMSGRPRAWLC